MAALMLALILLATVLASSVLDQLLPRVSLPLIQIGCGIFVSIIAQGQVAITLNPELFLVLFIAPLLFFEARECDKQVLWKNRSTMLSYAIGLVVATVLIIGFMLHWLAPSIPMAAAFALGAALGPTDPIAVASVSRNADIQQRQRATLQGESLLNDASGIVSFQFAIAAVVTGTFSALDAIEEFFISFFGALFVGIVLGYLLVKIAEKVRDWGLENTTFHVLFELLTPFIAYLLGESLHVSGVILVVACGITMTILPQRVDPSISRMNIVSSSVWHVLTFALNGIVFVMLGTQLPQAFGGFWVNDGIDNFDLILIIVLITLLMYATRFVWTLVSDALKFRKSENKPKLRELLKPAAVMTLCGAKGAITLAIMFSIPIYVNNGTAVQPFPQRDLLIFLSCGVILLSLLCATFLVPVLAPRKTSSDSQDDTAANEAIADVLRAVIEQLTAQQTPENSAALAPVIARYTERLERFKDEENLEDDSDTKLRLNVLQWEEDYIYELIEKDEIPPVQGYQYVSRITRLSNMLQHDKKKRFVFAGWVRHILVVLRKIWQRLRRSLPLGIGSDDAENQKAMKDIQIRVSKYAISRLEELMKESDVQSEKVSGLILEYQRRLGALQGNPLSITSLAKKSQIDPEAARLGLRIESEQIKHAYDEGRLSRAEAQKMRENVLLMQMDLEDYM